MTENSAWQVLNPTLLSSLTPWLCDTLCPEPELPEVLVPLSLNVKWTLLGYGAEVCLQEPGLAHIAGSHCRIRSFLSVLGTQVFLSKFASSSAKDRE